jgi:chemotaxis protein methyltransferase CheR
MPQPVPDTLLEQVSELVAQRLGLHFPAGRRRDVERALANAALESGYTDAQDCARALLRDPANRTRVELLASHLTVGETYFFRERKSFDVLAEHVLPELLRVCRASGRPLRIWSAGCCTGEEPYSIAMLLDRLWPDPGACPISILATDINPHFLARAAVAVYGEWSFRSTPQWARERYFKRRRDGRFELDPRIRRRVTFARLNLAEDVYPSPLNHTDEMDVVLCRNVLMYFTPEHARRAAEKLQRALARDGWLLVSPAETSTALFAPLSAVPFPGAMLYRKAQAAPPEQTAPPEQAGSALPAPWLTRTGQPATAPAERPRDTATAHAAPASGHAPVEKAHSEPARAARRCADEGRLGEAIQWCEQAIAADRLNPALYYLLASVEQEQNRSDAAARSLARALYLDADFALAHFTLANLRLAQGRRPAAEQHFANALRALGACAPDAIVPESDGLSAGRLIAIIESVLASQSRVTV